jgi:hypothetical protein
MEASSSTQAMAYINHNEITDLDVTRNTSEALADRLLFYRVHDD